MTPTTPAALPAEIEQAIDALVIVARSNAAFPQHASKDDVYRAWGKVHATIAAALESERNSGYETAIESYMNQLANHQKLRERAERLRRHILAGHTGPVDPAIEAVMGYGDQTSFQPGDLADDLMPRTTEDV